MFSDFFVTKNLAKHHFCTIVLKNKYSTQYIDEGSKNDKMNLSKKCKRLQTQAVFLRKKQG
ncbi:hypothetical protein GBL85_06365 [Streptococcus equi]|nr:hypothetical protein [Streptococcus equi]QGM14667.1 hypothetical protein GJS32_09820 [Streptococcus equi subsp. zooepidemicus]NBK45755.1 hypothetical protein [Streptococcus equi]NBK50025.1 hypothetical protein [Streptococcus equi]NBK58062.1 hypothetical protein [Streptococcus equi]